MFWELIATFIAGIGVAGIVLSLRKIFKKIPKWCVPAGAGIGMIAFGVYNEYSWYQHTASRLPAGSAVVATHAKPVFYQPWSYYRAPINRIVVVDKNATKIMDNPNIKQVQLYFMERRMPSNHLAVLVDCINGTQKDITSSQWGKTQYTSQLIQAVCTS